MKPVKKYLFFLLAYFFSSGCAYSGSQNDDDEKKVSNCILIGFDSVVYYYGRSDKMKELVKGNINDAVFRSQLIKLIKEHSVDKDFKVAFKPAGAGDVAKNVVNIIDLFNANNIQNRYLDSLDDNEKKFFNTENVPAVIADLNRRPLKLSLPKDDTAGIKNSTKSESTVSIILLNINNIYAYEGKNINHGKQYTYSDIDKCLRAESKKFPDDFKIVIELTDNVTYKNTVDILDKMTTNNIANYMLVNLSKEDEIFIKTLK